MFVESEHSLYVPEMLTVAVIILLAFIANTTYAQILIATDPDAICFANEECGPNRYCLFSKHSFSTCVPFDGLGGSCGPFSMCGEGLFCDFEGLVNSTRFICQKLLPLNATCSFWFSYPENCQAPYRCSPDTLTCQTLEPGLEGDSCFTTPDCADGFYCDQKQCIPRTPDFSVCTHPIQCGGTCLFRNNGSICFPNPSVGERCATQIGCKPTEDGNRTICNMPNGIDGRCVLASSLITTLGTECDQDLDTCDASRGLSCRFSSIVGKTVCQQRVTNPIGLTFCDPNSEFSQCLPSFGEPQDCLANIVPDSSRGTSLYQCSSREQQTGGICNSPTTICPEGTKCIFLPFISPLTGYCLPELSGGEVCGSPFDGVCSFPFVCEGGVCTKGETDFNPPTTLSGLKGSCGGDLKCAPGLICRESGEDLLCLLPLVEVGPMEECFPTSSLDKQCIDGLVCRADSNGLGVLRCRDPAVVGETCSTDVECAQGLTCAAENFLDTRCYDPENSLSIGDICGREGDPPCGAESGELLLCLPQAGSKVPKCQKFRGLYTGCDPEENVGCYRSSTCRLNICVPK